MATSLARVRMAASRRVVVLVGLCLSPLVVPRPVHADHQNVGHLIAAMQPCLPESATTATSTGIPACPVPKPVSDCDVDPTGALSFSGRVRYLISALGRRLTREKTASDIVMLTRGGAIVSQCDGTRYTGVLDAALTVRVTAADPACAGGACTLPDVVIPHTRACANGSCRGKTFALNAPPPPPIPLSVPWTGVVLGFSVVDSAGRPLASPGVVMGSPSAAPQIVANHAGDLGGASFPTGSSKWVARFVRAYEPCLPGTEDTVTNDGVAACSNPRPLSDCATDPLHAVYPQPSVGGNLAGHAGKGKVELFATTKRGEVEIRHARFIYLRDCTGIYYSGPLTLVAVVRATLADPACTGGFCTAVDTEVRVPVMAQNGYLEVKRVSLPIVSTLRTTGAAAILGAEIVRFDLRDASDNTAMTGPGYLVRCDRASGGSCFGN